MDSKLYNFWCFLSDNMVEIPIIQRDYAQGRNGKENLRKTFLANLKNALDGIFSDGETCLKLDFIYGSKENSKIQPLDGQQRLTTLWLLHWYVALKAGEMDNAVRVLNNFGYETRMSSREFCEQMCVLENFQSYKDGSVVDYITTRTWFYSAWKQDPTIQSMLQMLSGTKLKDIKQNDIIDGIEELFSDTSVDEFKDYWIKLTSDNCPIVFYYQELKDFGLSDDLYIKMNARGKQLTSFENFKADIVGYIEQIVRNNSDEDDDEEKRKWESLLDPEEGLPIKFDTKWMNLFWAKHSKGVKVNDDIFKSHQVDEIFFTFLNRLFWNELFTARCDEKYILDLGKDNDSNTQENKNKSYYYLNDSANSNNDYEKIAYEGLDIYKYYNDIIPWDFFDRIKRILDNYVEYLKSGAIIPVCKWNSKFSFIPGYVEIEGYNVEDKNNKDDTILKVATITQIERVVFFALCQYFDDNCGDVDSLRKWMRVVWNLVSGESEDGRPLIRSTQAMRTAMEFLERLDSHNIYQSLSQFDVSEINNGAFKNRCVEEIEKAKMILANPDFERKIIDAESYESFNGSIAFLFINGDGNVDWSDFDKKFSGLKDLVDGKGLKDEFKSGAKAIKKILSYCDTWTDQIESHAHNNHYIFGTSFNCWKNNILLRIDCEGKYLYAKSVHHLLIGDDVIGIGPRDLYDDYRKSAYSKLINSNIIERIYADVKGEDKKKYYIRWIYLNLCLYPSAEGFILSMPNRDTTLLSCLNANVIQLRNSDQIHDDIFWGWYVCFRCNEHHFVWSYDDFIYLADSDYRCIIRNEDATDGDAKFYRLSPVGDEMSPDAMVAELNKLVIDYAEAVGLEKK